jgi:hypothetical protein
VGVYTVIAVHSGVDRRRVRMSGGRGPARQRWPLAIVEAMAMSQP